MTRATGKPLPVEIAPVRFGSWIGGDRGGNPNVTPEGWARTCLLARWVAGYQPGAHTPAVLQQQEQAQQPLGAHRCHPITHT